LVVGHWLLGADMGAAYARLTGPFPLEAPMEVFAGVTEVIPPAALGASLLAVAAVAALSARRTGQTAPVPPAGGGPRLSHALAMIASLIVSGALVFATHARGASAVLRVNYYSKMQMWEELLAFAQRHPNVDTELGTQRQINRALYETGQLGSRAFAFRQDPAALLTMTSLNPRFGLEETLLALGSVNRAEHLATQSLLMRGPTPHTLRVLARVYMAKHEPQTARILLNHLAKDIVHRPWARAALARLDEDPDLSDDPEIQRIRRLMQREDRFDVQAEGPLRLWSTDAELLRLLAANPRNRMAFEYLMADCLLSSDLGHVKEYLARGMRYVHYDVLPTHYAEALILHEYLTNGRAGGLEGLPIDESTAIGARRALAIMARHGDDLARMAKVLTATMPDSYYRYYVARLAGRTTQ